jgi:hypothetical protein
MASATILTPRLHVSMTSNSAPATVNVTHPPSNTLKILAPRNMRSMAASGATSKAAFHSGQPHPFQMTTSAITAVTTHR